MKRYSFVLLSLVVGAFVASTWFVSYAGLVETVFNDHDPDMPVTGAEMDREEYLIKRNEYMDMVRGYDTAEQQSRTNSIREMERSERALREQQRLLDQPDAAAWVPLGPAPIPVGGGNSGRTSAIAVHPTNPNIAYVGTAQGGLYRTLDGGTTWTPMMDNALTLAIGAVAISPSDPSTVFVGTGESTLCGSGCFIGVGLYRITNADTSPVLSDVLNRNSNGDDVFTGRAISEVLVHPTDPNTLFVTTTSGVAGIGASTSGLTLPALGLYRTTNAMSASPTFAKIAMGITDRSITDAAMDPGDPNKIYVAVLGSSNSDGGVYYSSDALSATPTFTHLLTTSATGSNSRVEVAATRVGGTTTVYAASGQGNGTVYKSVDAAPFTQVTGGAGFCNPQCFYDIAVAADPTNANNVYLAGSPSLVFGRSTDGGSSFASTGAGVHVDSHAITVAPSDPNVIYFGTDGGIWRSNNAGLSWNSLNNSTYSATQFMGLAVHPLERNYTLGGTQDNGTEYLFPDGRQWIRSDGGDGGFAAVDQTATGLTTATAYHTYYNQTNSQIGFRRSTAAGSNGSPIWSTFFGCGGTSNGINCADSTLFYAPMVTGPVAADSGGTNTLYFGTNHLYRSSNQGATMQDVSGNLIFVISTIAIAPQDDNIRLVGTSSGGRVFRSTTAGATTMTDIHGPIPNRYVGRIAIDPTNSNVAYVCLNGFGIPNQHVWKTTNLLADPPTWTASGVGIPDTPVDSFAIDPLNPNNLYAGTDIGVFRSQDGGATWTPFNNGLPRIAVFGMGITANGRVLRIATHGRGMYDYVLYPDRTTADFNGDGKSDLAVYRPSNGTWYVARPTGIPSQNFDATVFGAANDIPLPGDYDGDGKTDFAVFRPSQGNWYVLGSSSGFSATNFGLATDLPVQGDYDGDGKTDIAVFRPSMGVWYILGSTAGFSATQFGASADKPVPGDYDGDGKADFAVFRPSDSTWYVQNSLLGFSATQFGLSSDKVVPADYDGDGRTDIAVYRNSDGTWYRLNSLDNSFSAVQFGISGDIPTPGDFDGDGRTDISVFRSSDGNWYRLNSRDGSFVQFAFGSNNDMPVESRYVPIQ